MKKLFMSALLGVSVSVFSANAFSFSIPSIKDFEQPKTPKIKEPEERVLPPEIKNPKDKDKKEDDRRILIKFKENAPYDLIKEILTDLGIDVEKYFKFIDVFVLKLPEGLPTEEAIKLLKDLDFVEYVEPDILFKLSAKKNPNDTYYERQWGLNNSYDTDIDAPEGWAKETGSKDIIIAIIDTGVDYNHEDLKDNIWKNSKECSGRAGVDDDGNGYVDDCYGWNALNDNGNPKDDNGHGTHVAGIAAAVGNNGKGIAGVSWHSKILPLKFMDSNGQGRLSDAIECMEYIVNNVRKGENIKIANASWGGYQTSSALKDAIKKLKEQDILFVAAAGNDKNNNDERPYYPASFDLANIISVAATDKNDNLADFSNYGKNTVDVAAPGAEIISTYPGNKYRYMSGTSMSTPHVSGLAALIWSQNKGYSYYDVKSIIESKGDKLSSLSGLIRTESRINVDKSLAKKEEEENPPNNPNPPEEEIKEADIRVKPESYDYGKVKIGDEDTNKFTITNIGDETLKLYSLYIDGTDAKEFKIVSNTCSTDLDPGKSCYVSIEFAPKDAGVKKADFIIKSNDPDEGLKKVPLKGEGVEEKSGFFDFFFFPALPFKFF
ncbi:MAG: S8 family serine peptidase [Aquificae bacterium]|nr:S8 family serine peptidase [Aquificota bacterium]